MLVERTCNTCAHRDGGDACAGCWHCPEDGFISRTGAADYPHWEPDLGARLAALEARLQALEATHER